MIEAQEIEEIFVTALLPSAKLKSPDVFLIPLAIMIVAITLLIIHIRLENKEASSRQKNMQDGEEFDHAVEVILKGDFWPYLMQIGRALENSADERTSVLLRDYNRCMSIAKTEGHRTHVNGSEQNVLMRSVVRGYLKQGGTIDIAETGVGSVKKWNQ